MLAEYRRRVGAASFDLCFRWVARVALAHGVPWHSATVSARRHCAELVWSIAHVALPRGPFGRARHCWCCEAVGEHSSSPPKAHDSHLLGRTSVADSVVLTWSFRSSRSMPWPTRTYEELLHQRLAAQDTKRAAACAAVRPRKEHSTCEGVKTPYFSEGVRGPRMGPRQAEHGGKARRALARAAGAACSRAASIGGGVDDSSPVAPLGRCSGISAGSTAAPPRQLMLHQDAASNPRACGCWRPPTVGAGRIACRRRCCGGNLLKKIASRPSGSSR